MLAIEQLKSTLSSSRLFDLRSSACVLVIQGLQSRCSSKHNCLLALFIASACSTIIQVKVCVQPLYTDVT